MTEDEIKLMERDAKRRRIKYKMKSVHTSRKTSTEIIREIINSQMEAYEDWLKHELNLETSSTNTALYKREATTSPQSSSKHSYDEERLNGVTHHSHRSLSKESNQSKHYNKYERQGHSNHSSRERSPHHKSRREHLDEYYSAKKLEYEDRHKHRRSKEPHNFNGSKYIDEYRINYEKEKHRNYKKEYYEVRYSKKQHYKDERGRSRERHRYKEDNKYKADYNERYYENKYDMKRSHCSVSVKDNW